MQSYWQWIIRGSLLTVVLLSASVVGWGYAVGNEGLAIRQQANLPEDKRVAIAPQREGRTVITTQRRKNADRAPGYIVSISSDGHVQYYNDTYNSYWDVDPVPNTTATVLYVASHDADAACPSINCWRNVVERLNITTGQTTRIYERTVAARGSTRWHDIDAVNDTHYLIGDIADNRVFLVDTRNGVIEWSWETAPAFPPSAGGKYPDDWTHLNDVERLADGRIMASLRNMDQVVFLTRQGGLQPNWTLGQEDNYSTLYEQHNPDYIPESMGGPAILVSDSENNRIVEYQRKGGKWVKSWEWADSRLQWPRDADRLPSGRTLVTDTHGGRVLEVAPNGTIVWQLEIIAPYEAERLGTGDESTGGPSAAKVDLISRHPQVSTNSNPVISSVLSGIFIVERLLPNIVVNGLLWAVPPWMGVREILAVAIGVGGIISLGIAEVRWRYTISLRTPFAGTVRSPVILSRRKANE